MSCSLALHSALSDSSRFDSERWSELWLDLLRAAEADVKTLIFCRRICGAVIAIGVRCITVIHPASAHQIRLNKCFISGILYDILLKTANTYVPYCSPGCQGSLKTVTGTGAAVNNLKLYFQSSDILSREINNLCREGWILIYLCLCCCTKRHCTLLLQIKRMQMPAVEWKWLGSIRSLSVWLP